MKATDTAIGIPTVPQAGANVDQLKANLKKIKLPEGFKIELYAVVPDARCMAVAPSTKMLCVGMHNPAGLDINPKDKVIWTTDNQVEGLGDEVPPGELNRITGAGQHFGFPYWHGKFKVAGSPAAPELKDMQEPAGAIFPASRVACSLGSAGHVLLHLQAVAAKVPGRHVHRIPWFVEPHRAQRLPDQLRAGQC